MNLRILFYYITVLSFFVVIMGVVYYIVNTTRVEVTYEDYINPTEILWNVDPEDSTLRIKEPLYLTNDYFLTENQYFKIKQDTLLFNQLYNDTLFKQGCIMNLKAPYILWKSAKNDTLKVIKNQKTLKFIKKT